MKFCKEHHSRLHTVLTEKNLGQFIAPVQEDYTAQFEAFLKQEPPAEPIGPVDPLMEAQVAILNKFIEGTSILSLIGDKCPLCEINSDLVDCTCGTKDHAEQWIGSVTDWAVEVFTKKGWLVPASHAN